MSPAASPESSTTRKMLCRPITISTAENLPPCPRVDDAGAVLLENRPARDGDDALGLLEAHDPAHLLAGLHERGGGPREGERRPELRGVGQLGDLPPRPEGVRPLRASC
jgi:hypothetical protein